MKRFISFIALIFMTIVFAFGAHAAETSAKNQAASAPAKVSKSVSPKEKTRSVEGTGSSKKEVASKALPVAVEDSLAKDRVLLDRLQRDTFRYMWEHTFKESGLAYEDSRNKATGQATIGGTGFGIAAIVVASERGWISREKAVERILKISTFLRDKTDRKKFHGAFPHWLNGRTGKTFSFSEKDNGADLVETAFLIQGLLIARSYFNGDDPQEVELRKIATELWHDVDWHWFSKGENNGLYWHWSPEHGFGMDMKISGFNEAMVVYVLALSSPTHPISRETAKFWYSTDEYQPKYGNGYTIEAANAYAGCMFLSHYSFIGLDPRRMADSYVKKGYMVRNTTHALMNRAYCLESAPDEHQFSEGFWGLTACDIKGGYRYQSAYNEVGTVAPTAALASMPYVPEYAMRVLWNIHDNYKKKMWGKYGPYDAFSLKDKWFAKSYLAIDQLAIPCMVENYRSGLLWSLFMNIPEVKQGLGRMGVLPLTPANGFDQVVVPLMITETGYQPDALDLRRHPDTGLYTVPYSCSNDSIVTFTVTDAAGKVLRRFTREGRKGYNEFAFEQFIPAGVDRYHLTMRTGDFTESLPIRFN